MPEVRLLGGLLGVAAVVIGVLGLRRHHAAGTLRIRDVGVLFVGFGLLALAVFPRWFDSLAGVFGVSSLEGRRIGILMLVGMAVLAIALFVAVGRIGSLEGDIAAIALELSSRNPAFERSTEYPDRFIAAVLPAYNEEDALPAVLAAMPRAVGEATVVTIVVSDGSTDATVAVAERHADVVLETPIRRGSGAAIRIGTAFALRRGATVLVTLDADGQHDPGEMGKLVEPVLSRDVDLCQGSRSVNTKSVSGDAARVVGISLFGWLMRSTGIAHTSDPSNGYRAISAVAYQRFDLTEDQFYVGEFVVRSAQANLRIREVPVTVSPRSHGESKKPGSMVYGFGFMRGIVRALVRPQSRR